MKTLLVVGASSDIGSALIRQVGQEYGLIWAHYLHWNDHLESLKTAYGDKIRWLKADLNDFSQLENMIAEIKASGQEPDHLVHLPMSKMSVQRFSKTDWQDFQAGWELSVRSAVLLFKAFLPSMQKSKKGKIIIMLTSNTVVTPAKFESAYVCVKYALLGLMKSLAVEYADKGICINAVSPDMMDTKYIADLPHLLREQVAQSHPSGRLLTVEEVVPTFAFLLSSGADHITGENILVT